jgi:hypothetical protein
MHLVSVFGDEAFMFAIDTALSFVEIGNVRLSEKKITVA